MNKAILPLMIGFGIDLLIGDPHNIPHPVVWIGKMISLLEKRLRSVFPKNPDGEKNAGIVLWVIVVTVSAAAPLLLLSFLGRFSPWLQIAVESIMYW